MKKLKWTKDDSKLATLEGWDLYESTGSLDGNIQVQRNDDQAILTDDIQAWTIVNKGTRPHHLKAKSILKKENAKEYNRILNCN